MPNAARPEDRPVGTVTRVLRILEVLVEEKQAVTVAIVAERTCLPTSTAHRLLRLLHDEGYVAAGPQPGTYQPGPELQRAAALLAGRQSIATIARPVMERIVAACGETCLLGVYLPYARQMMFVQQVQSPHALRFEITLNVHTSAVWGSSGRVMLAYLPDDEVRTLLAEAGPSITGKTIDNTEYFKTLRRIRQQQHDTTRGEKLANSVGIAAPVFSGDTIASLTLTIPAVRFRASDARRLTELVVNGAAEISKTLGHARQP